VTTNATDRSEALVERLFGATIGALELFSVYLGAELGLSARSSTTRTWTPVR
jgi:hypothetical protein